MLLKIEGADILICDTAGRLQNKANLMNELQKLEKLLIVMYLEHHILALDANWSKRIVTS